jgi:hypothetical protein
MEILMMETTTDQVMDQATVETKTEMAMVT